MKDLLTSGKVGNIELNAQKKIREDIQKRWERIGLVEGLEGHVKETVATLYENQARHLIYEATSADNSGSFETVVFPLIRRVFSKLLANDLVSVQAMNLPIGKLFFIKPVTSERKWDLQFNNNDPTSYITGGTGEHNGLMGYNRENRNQNGAIDNRYYLPDECVNSTALKKQWRMNDGTMVYVDAEQAVPAKLYSVLDNREIAVTSLAMDTTTFALTITGGVYGSATAYPMVGSGVVSPTVTQYMKKTLYDLFYDDFLFDNSKGKITITVSDVKQIVTLDSMAQVVPVTGNLPLNANDDSLSSIMLEVGGFHNFNKGRLTGPDGNEMDTEAFLASLKVIATTAITDGTTNTGYSTFAAGESIPFRVVTQKYGNQIVHYDDICTGDGKILIELDLTKPCKKQGMTVNGYIGVTPGYSDGTDSKTKLAGTNFQIAWASYDSLELETEMGEVSFQLSSVTVAVEERKLRATWSPELAQDVSAFHSIDAEAELTAILSEQIAAEVDREILRDLRKAAAWQARWDYNGWQRLGTTSTVYTQKDWNQTLMTKINQLSAQIQKATLRGGANIIVVSAEVSAVLNDLEYFHVSDASAESLEYNMGIEKIGSLQGRYQVIVDPYSPHWSIILAHHGTSLLDTGYIYAPYIPMALTPTMYSPFNFAPVKGISCRYAKKLVNNRYFAHLRCDGLVHWNVNELR